jgi:hypothetical protein
MGPLTVPSNQSLMLLELCRGRELLGQLSKTGGHDKLIEVIPREWFCIEKCAG